MSDITAYNTAKIFVIGIPFRDSHSRHCRRQMSPIWIRASQPVDKNFRSPKANDLVERFHQSQLYELSWISQILEPTLQLKIISNIHLQGLPKYLNSYRHAHMFSSVTWLNCRNFCHLTFKILQRHPQFFFFFFQLKIQSRKLHWTGWSLRFWILHGLI